MSINLNKIRSLSDKQLEQRAKQLLHNYKIGKFHSAKDNEECPHILAEYVKRLEKMLDR